MNKKQILFIGTFCLAILVIFVSCDKKVGKPDTGTTTTTTGATTTSGSTTGGGPTGCDTVTFAKHIKPIIDSKCGSATGCHTGTAPSAGLLLSSYDDVKAQGQGGRIKARVIDANPSAMPPDGSPTLTSLQKSMITCWLNNGYKQ